ncbi:hypothetical protein BJY04DRAFT_182052 [Aspergillus karnatakaensis]|uniref:uncharacterized protein n=1 Tax=Aspergillus karnatakaensis TaxID=1810916 RepID=UPI003CCDAA3F
MRLFSLTMLMGHSRQPQVPMTPTLPQAPRLSRYRRALDFSFSVDSADREAPSQPTAVGEVVISSTIQLSKHSKTISSHFSFQRRDVSQLGL